MFTIYESAALVANGLQLTILTIVVCVTPIAPLPDILLGAALAPLLLLFVLDLCFFYRTSTFQPTHGRGSWMRALRRGLARSPRTQSTVQARLTDVARIVAWEEAADDFGPQRLAAASVNAYMLALVQRHAQRQYRRFMLANATLFLHTAHAGFVAMLVFMAKGEVSVILPGAIAYLAASAIAMGSKSVVGVCVRREWMHAQSVLKTYVELARTTGR